MKRFSMLALMVAVVWGLGQVFGEQASTSPCGLDEQLAKTKKHRDGGSKDGEEHEEELAGEDPYQVLARR